MPEADSHLRAAALSLCKSIAALYKIHRAANPKLPRPSAQIITELYIECFASTWTASGSLDGKQKAKLLAESLLSEKRAAAVADASNIGIDPLYDVAQLQPQVASPVVLDVGANRGQSIARVRERFPTAIIHAFEPLPSEFDRLSRRVKDLSDVYLSNVALGSKPGRAALIENTFSNMSSFLEFGPSCWGEESRRYEVIIDTVDDYCQRHSLKDVDVLKIDTQGYDLEVLKGSSRMLREGRVRFVLLEIIFSNMYRGLPELDHIYRTMRDFGFSLVSFYKLHYQNNRAAWTDALFIRDGKGRGQQ
jgi:FkbM family methyltransferase